jgi:aspartyl-tRNA(Asn)/glutamyl-tRNA(Gln) amidotransferase subunit C
MEIDVEKVAKLSMLQLTEDEKSLYAGQLGSILEYIHKLNELDTSMIEPTSHVLALNNVFREDTPGQSLSEEEALRNAPDPSDNFYRVPRII